MAVLPVSFLGAEGRPWVAVVVLVVWLIAVRPPLVGWVASVGQAVSGWRPRGVWRGLISRSPVGDWLRGLRTRVALRWVAAVVARGLASIGRRPRWASQWSIHFLDVVADDIDNALNKLEGRRDLAAVSSLVESAAARLDKLSARWARWVEWSHTRDRLERELDQLRKLTWLVEEAQKSKASAEFWKWGLTWHAMEEAATDVHRRAAHSAIVRWQLLRTSVGREFDESGDWSWLDGPPAWITPAGWLHAVWNQLSIEVRVRVLVEVVTMIEPTRFPVQLPRVRLEAASWAGRPHG